MFNQCQNGSFLSFSICFLRQLPLFAMALGKQSTLIIHWYKSSKRIVIKYSYVEVTYFSDKSSAQILLNFGKVQVFAQLIPKETKNRQTAYKNLVIFVGEAEIEDLVYAIIWPNALILIRPQQSISKMNPSQLIENRSVLLIFRDCLKLAPRMVDDPLRVQTVRRLMKQEFSKNKHVINQQEIRNLKLAAAKGISNYIIHSVKQQYNIPDSNHNSFEDDELDHDETHESHPK